jgi:hypothetical protein
MAIDTTTPTSRRALLAGTVGGLAALAAQALGRPRSASAHDPDDVLLGGSNTATFMTRIYNSFPDRSAIGGEATAAGSGVYGSSQSGPGIDGYSGSGQGVYGSSLLGVGVFGEALNAGTNSIKGLKQNAGTAVWGDIQATLSTDGAVVGTTNGTGPGVRGVNSVDGSGVWGRSVGTGNGIYGESVNGRGGRFVGKKAQIRLDPSTAITHPSSGAAGDIFLDKSKRLWFCKGGTTWVKLA